MSDIIIRTQVYCYSCEALSIVENKNGANYCPVCGYDIVNIQQLMNDSTIKNCAEIIRQHLVDNDYDGLVNSECECGCGLDELTPHEDCWITTCYPAFEIKCVKCGETVYSANKDAKYCFECEEIEEEGK